MFISFGRVVVIHLDEINMDCFYSKIQWIILLTLIDLLNK